jgi:Ser/Thr protein kinase RdoA (MazF antagonist)
MAKMTSLSFAELLPDTIFDAVMTQGFRPTGALFPLNSYENRVYEIALEDHEFLIAKFYRPQRWSPEGIAEEHAFVKRLAEAEIPVVCPYDLSQSTSHAKSLGLIDGIYHAFFPKFRGREHDETTNEDRCWLGRTLARLHNVSENFKSQHRMALNPKTYGDDCLDFILSQKFLPDDLKSGLDQILSQALDLTDPFFTKGLKTLLVHGDCHPGNVLWNQNGPHLLDFDDAVIAPPVQDVWMLFNGSHDEQKNQKDFFLEGYEMFRPFDQNTFRLAEPLRTLRLIRHSAWIGQRYDEPLFQKTFPYYQERRYWEEFSLTLREQISVLEELSWC